MFMVKKEVGFFSVGNTTKKFQCTTVSFIEKRQKRDEFIASLLKLFSHDLLVSIKKNSLNFKQISFLMLGSLSRWLTIMVVAARWKVSQIWPIFQLIWNQSISLKSLKIIEMFFSTFFCFKSIQSLLRYSVHHFFDVFNTFYLE